VKQHSRPTYAWKAELAATLSLWGGDLGGSTSFETGILGQIMVVALANLWLLSQWSTLPDVLDPEDITIY